MFPCDFSGGHYKGLVNGWPADLKGPAFCRNPLTRSSEIPDKLFSAWGGGRTTNLNRFRTLFAALVGEPRFCFSFTFHMGFCEFSVLHRRQSLTVVFMAKHIPRDSSSPKECPYRRLWYYRDLSVHPVGRGVWLWLFFLVTSRGAMWNIFRSLRTCLWTDSQVVY